MNAKNLIVYAIPVFLLAMLVEYLISKKSNIHLYKRSDFLANMGIGIGTLVFGGIASLYGLTWFYFFSSVFADLRIKIFGVEYFSWAWYVWIIAVFCEDLTSYWFHRISHSVRILWASHIVHHSSSLFNFSTAVRNGWPSVLYKPIFWIWMSIVGFHPLMIVACMNINVIYQFFCHTKLLPRWDKLSGFLCTPGIHAIHHGKSPQHIDKNFSGIFIFFDRLFGTYEPINEGDEVVFGVTKPPKSDNIIEITIHEFRNVAQECATEVKFWNKLKIIFGPPR